MTRLIRPGRIGGGQTEPRLSAPGRALASLIAVLAISGAGSLAPTGSALAQTAGTARPISLGDLFKAPDSIDLNDSADVTLNAAIVNASMRHCRTQKTNIKVIMAKGDDLFQPALGTTRRDVIDAVLKKQGIAGERYTVAYGGIGAKDDVQVEYGEIIPDKDKPKLVTNSAPLKGKKVQANGKIAVTMVATDRANQWQTGIKSIQLQNISTNPNGILVEPTADYGRLPNPCNAATMQRTHVVTYTVPSDAPPIVRLRAIAEDFAGNIDTDVAEFPTGDWSGRLEWKAHQAGPSGSTGDFWGHMDLVLTYDGRGNLEGHLVGAQSQKTDGPCTSESMTAGRLNARLVGSHTPSARAMSIQIMDAQFTPPVIGPCRQYPGRPFAAPSVHTWPQFDQALRKLDPLPDGGFRSNGSWPVPQGTTQYSLTMRPAGN